MYSSSPWSSSQQRLSSACAAAGVRAAGEWFQNSPSRAACTNVPLTAWGDGGSGRCSICEKRKASGQLVKATTFDGLNVRGRSSAMPSGYGGVVTRRHILPRREKGGDVQRLPRPPKRR